jgi:hypothetical protein
MFFGLKVLAVKIATDFFQRAWQILVKATNVIKVNVISFFFLLKKSLLERLHFHLH